MKTKKAAEAAPTTNKSGSTVISAVTLVKSNAPRTRAKRKKDNFVPKIVGPWLKFNTLLDTCKAMIARIESNPDGGFVVKWPTREGDCFLLAETSNRTEDGLPRNWKELPQ